MASRRAPPDRRGSASADWASASGDVPTDPGLGLALYVAAVRELYEEAGILLARSFSNGTARGLDAATCDALAAVRAPPSCSKGRAPWWMWYDAHLDLTPRGPRVLLALDHARVLAAPLRHTIFRRRGHSGQTASHCGVETIDRRWSSRRRMHSPGRRFGEITLVSVTMEHLRVLAEHRTVASALALLGANPSGP